MNPFRQPIFIAASPNNQADDAWLAFRLLLQPWNWRHEAWGMRFETELSKYLNIEHVITVDSGRSALEVALKSLGIGEGDEVITPSFTCVVVPNAVYYTGAKPIYLDTNENDLNANYSEIEKYITPNTKVIIVQHTFGKFVDVTAIRDQLSGIGRKDIKIIEDFAHVIQRNLELKGDIGILTFGIEKVISSVRGGAIITNLKTQNAELKTYVEKLSSFPINKTIICLMNPLFWFFATPLHAVGIGKYSIGGIIRYIWRKLGFLGIMVEAQENLAIKPNWFPAKMSPALARLGMKQLEKLDRFNEHRAMIVRIYEKDLAEVSDNRQQISEKDPNPKPQTPKQLAQNRVFLRYPIILKNRTQYVQIWNKAKQLGITLGDWYAVPLYGKTVNEETYKKLSYNPDTTPVTVQKCKLTLNLPTSINISEKRAEELAKKIKNIIDQNKKNYEKI